MKSQTLVDQRDVIDDGLAVTREHDPRRELARGPHRLDVLHQRLRTGGRCLSVERPRYQRVGRDVSQQVVAADQQRSGLVPEDRVRRAVSRPMQRAQRPVGERQLVAVVQRTGHLAARAKRPERRPDRAERDRDVVRDPVAAHDRLRELVVRRGAGGEVLEVRPERAERRDLGAGAPGQDLEQADVIHVLVGEHDQLEVLDRMAVLGERALELVQRLSRVRAGVDQRQRPVLDQVAVDAPHQERGRHRQSVDAGACGERECFLGARCGLRRRAQERITASTSSRRRSMSSAERSDSRHSRSNGSVLEGRTLKCQSSYSTDSPSSRYCRRVRITRGELLDLGVPVVDLCVDLPGDEVARPVGLEQLGRLCALRRQQLEHQQRRDRPGIRAIEVVEVVVARHLAAEDGVLLAHPRLEERVADAVHERSPAGALDYVGDCPAGPHVVEDRRLGLLFEHRLGQQRGHEVAVDECALLVDEEAPVGVAVPRDPEVGALLDDLAHDELPILRQQRVRLVIGEVAVGLEIGLDQVESEALEDRADHRAGHAVPAVDHDLERLDHTGIDELQRGLVELVPDRDVLDAPAARGIAEPFLDPRLDVADPGVARQRDRPALDELGAGVALGIVRRSAHQPAVELPGSDQVIEHLGATSPASSTWAPSLHMPSR